MNARGGAPAPARTVADHLSRVLAEAAPLRAETAQVADAVGRTLAEPVHALLPLPVWDHSAMDGFAVRFDDVAAASEDHPVRLRVVADVPAGSTADPALAAGEAVRIMTGGPFPTDADTVVPFEDTADGLVDSLTTAEVRRAPRARGAHVRRSGESAARGAEIAPAGVPFGPLRAAAAAAAGVAAVRVIRRPRVAVISTGSELVAAGAPLERGFIPESNTVLLAGLVRAAGGEVVLVAHVVDDATRFRAVLDEAARAGADVVLTSGGVSAGAFEVVRDTLAGAGVEFSRVAMQPGKPQGFGRLDSGALFFGLPGNPVSAAVSFEVFARPALLALQGRADVHRPVLRLPAAVGWRTPAGRTQILPATVDRSIRDRWTVRPAADRAAHVVGGLAHADALVVVAPDAGDVRAGDAVDVWLWD